MHRAACSSGTAEQAACKAGVKCGDDEGGQLVRWHVVAEHRHPAGVLLDGEQHCAHGRTDDTPGQHIAGKKDDREQHVHRQSRADANGVFAEAEHRNRHAGDAVLAAGVVRQRRILHEIGHLAECQGDHREVDADAAHREPADHKAGQAGRGGARSQRQPYAAQRAGDQQVGRDETADAVERRLSERQQSGEPKQDVEARPIRPQFSTRVRRSVENPRYGSAIARPPG